MFVLYTCICIKYRLYSLCYSFRYYHVQYWGETPGGGGHPSCRPISSAVNRTPFLRKSYTWPAMTPFSTTAPNDPLKHSFQRNFFSKNFVNFQLKMANFRSDLTKFTLNDPYFWKFKSPDFFGSHTQRPPFFYEILHAPCFALVGTYPSSAPPPPHARGGKLGLPFSLEYGGGGHKYPKIHPAANGTPKKLL